MGRFSEKGLFIIGTLLVVLLAGWLYWPTLQLPLIYDTLLHIRIVGDLNWATVWLPTDTFAFYRPMTFFPMLIIEQLFGSYPAWLLHSNNVVQHAANAGLLAWLSWRLWPDWRRAVAAGVIFAVFPFAYQAVTIYGHNVHPAITGFILVGLHCYLTAVSSPSPRKWWGLTWGLFGVMLLTHETAVLFGLFAALVQINAQPAAFDRWWQWLRQMNWRPLLRLPWLWFLLAGAAYTILYQFLPISRSPQAATVGNSLWLNALYLWQAAVFPLAWFAHLLPTVSGQTVTLVALGLVLAGSIWLAWQRPVWRRPLLLGWGWWAAASLLIGIALPTDYLLRGARLLYLSSVGVALLWATLLAGLWRDRSAKNSWVSLGTWTAVLGFILITSGQFVQTKLNEYEKLTEPVRVWQDHLHPFPGADVVFVNLPQWLDVPPQTYAVGVEFVSMLGDYLFVEELTEANSGNYGATWAVAVPELQSQTAVAYGVHAQHSWPPFTEPARFIFITNYEDGQPQTRFAGSLTHLAEIGDLWREAQLGAYDFFGATADACQDRVKVKLIWASRLGDIADTTSVFVQVLAEDGRLLAQADGPPLGIRPSLLAASPDWLLSDEREIMLPEGETAVPHTVLVGVYNFATGERSLATDAAGEPLPDNAWRIPVASCAN